MNRNIYTVYDQVAKTYVTPFFLHNDNEARRLFNEWCKDKTIPMSAHPADYVLYCIGFYDTDTGAIESLNPHNMITRGSPDEPPELKAVGGNNNE